MWERNICYFDNKGKLGHVRFTLQLKVARILSIVRGQQPPILHHMVLIDVDSLLSKSKGGFITEHAV